MNGAMANYQMTAEAWPVINRMTSLAKAEVTALKRYIQVEVRDGNWATFDEIQCQVLGSTNGLTGFFGVADGTNIGSVSFGAQGASFSGTNHLRTNFIPSSDQSSGATDAAYSVYIFNPSVASASTQRVFAVRSSPNWIQIASQISGDPNLYITVNSTTSVGPNTDGHENEEYFTGYRSSNTIYFWKNGSQLTSGGISGTTKPTTYDLFIGTINLEGTAHSTSRYFGDVGFVAMGAKTNLDVAKHYTNVLDFMTDLSAI